MAQLQKGTTYITGDQVTAANLNALVDSGLLIAGAITDQTAKTVPLAADTILLHSAADIALRKTTLTQLFATPQPLGATTASSVAATTGTFSSTLGVTGVSTLAAVSATTITASGTISGNTAGTHTGAVVGNITSSVAQITLLKLTPELGYATSGAIALNLGVSSNAQISLTGNSTFSLTSIASGQINIFSIINGTGSSINMTWPAFVSAGGSFPATLTAGQAMVFTLYSYGTTTASVYAVSSL